LQRLEKSFSSLAVCYVFLASLAALLLIYARLELQASPPDWSNIIGGLLHGSSSFYQVSAAKLLAGARSALLELRDRMHTTWLFFVVFGAVWLACLLWMQIERHRREIDFTRREAYWIIGVTLLVFAFAVLYGLGTNGILARRFPTFVPISDFVAIGFLLILPLAAWSRLGGLQEEQEEADLDWNTQDERRSRGFLGLDDDTTNARLVESMSRLEVKPVDLLAAVQALHPDVRDEHAKTATPLFHTAETPVAAPVPRPALPAVNPITPVPPLTPAIPKPEGTSIEGFRRHLTAMNESWQRIEAIRGEIDEWLELRRREAIAHLDAHPRMRTSALEKSLFEDFPSEKLAAVDAEWAEIRNANLEISRWFEEVPLPDQSK
jgi:hypothetical protein